MSSSGGDAFPTWPPDTFGGGRDAAVEAFVPLPKEPVDDFPFLVHHESLDLVDVGAPVVPLRDQQTRL